MQEKLKFLRVSVSQHAIMDKTEHAQASKNNVRKEKYLSISATSLRKENQSSSSKCMHDAWLPEMAYCCYQWRKAGMPMLLLCLPPCRTHLQGTRADTLGCASAGSVLSSVQEKLSAVLAADHSGKLAGIFHQLSHFLYPINATTACLHSAHLLSLQVNNAACFAKYWSGNTESRQTHFTFTPDMIKTAQNSNKVLHTLDTLNSSELTEIVTKNIYGPVKIGF